MTATATTATRAPVWVAHQLRLKRERLTADLAALGRGQAWMDALRTADFEVHLVQSAAELAECREFIRTYEWLGSSPKRGYGHVVCAVRHTETGALAGVTWFCSPNEWSTLLPDAKEMLLARGCTVSWSPPNLGSWMTSRALDLLVKHLDAPVIVSGYADSEAGERGGIYRALSWFKVPGNAGTTTMYTDPKKHGYEFSERKFRIQSTWKRFIRQAGITGIVWRAPTKPGGTSWNPDWEASGEAGEKLKAAVAAWRASCTSREVPPKVKFVTVRGRTPKEHKRLTKLLKEKIG
jgi:hypothetical protein